MEMIMDSKRLPLIMCITFVLGFSCASLSARYEFLYIMVTALIVEAFIFDEDRKLNFWKYIVANLVLLFSVFSLFTFM
ncbi:hypothetical protein QWY14_15110 [Planococcus sp. N028]|uniref:Lipoprotein n=1 Tax=Planococcus shixiaomingii TaxID=3058393 RepID=A0ABT8N5H4_9BACL|nr:MULTISPECIES: hypothetical protein [unclassified Planococcus (in: firmicutes)]MDN7243131.1 hypothetical protein [Planococcus sp. N028]WKA55075.1 hypothetical protein QWY21_01475 [Planococcus sp. N022]